MYILGISAYYHDSAAALIKNDDIVAAAQEERFTRKKHDAAFPRHAIEYCLSEAQIKLKDVDKIIFYDKPFLKFERLLETYLAYAPRGFTSFQKALPVWLREKLFLKDMLVKELAEVSHDKKADLLGKLLFSEHHLSHAASAFYPSPFSEAIVLTMDGVGEWATTSVAVGRGANLEIVKEIHFPHSLGLLYSAFTYHAGFKVNSGEYKLMGLAPYGEPRYAQKIMDEVIHVREDGSFALNMKYFSYCSGLTMTNKRFDELFGRPPRQPETPIEEFHMDMAASIQRVMETIVLKLTAALREEYGINNLCLAGGVALNCVANGKIKRQDAFHNIWVQPASGDAGGALGAAFIAYHLHQEQPRRMGATGQDTMKGGYLGPAFTEAEILKDLHESQMVFQRLDDQELVKQTAASLANDDAVGWFQGRMEFGPRALGNRSILGNPKSESMQRTLNTKIKFRESFRPFAPSVLADKVSEWFDFSGTSPYMLMVAPVHPTKMCPLDTSSLAQEGFEKLKVRRSEIPAITHVDGSARIQTVHPETNQRYHDLISAFYDLTGCPVIINTSFNIRGEPIVCRPRDAVKCFMGTNMDTLVVGNYLLRKADQDQTLVKHYQEEFSLD